MVEPARTIAVMDTAEFYRMLMMRSSGPTPEPLLRAAAQHVHAHEGRGPSSDMLLRGLADDPATPGDIIASFLGHPDPLIRRDLLLHDGLDPAVRLSAVRKERSTVTLCAVAANSGDPAVLANIARRKFTGPASVRLRSRLLWNADLPVDAAADLLLVVEQQLLAGEPDEDHELIDSAVSAFANFPGLANLVIARLTIPRLLLAAARSSELTGPGWQYLEQVLVRDAVARLADGEPIPIHDMTSLNELLRMKDCPAGLRVRVSETILERNAGQGRPVEPARQILAEQAATDADSALARLAASSDISDLRMVLAHKPLPSHIAWQVALNPAADTDMIVDATRRTQSTDFNLRTLMRTHTDPDLRANLCWALGPDAVAAVPAADRTLVLELVFDTLAAADRGGHTRFGPVGVWVKFAESLDGDTLNSLSWPVVRKLASDYSPIAAWLIPQLTRALALPGASRVFAEVDATFTGTTPALFSALDGVAASA